MPPFCAAHLGGGPLGCCLPLGHPHGHVYASTSGVPDCPKEEL